MSKRLVNVTYALNEEQASQVKEWDKIVHDVVESVVTDDTEVVYVISVNVSLEYFDKIAVHLKTALEQQGITNCIYVPAQFVDIKEIKITQ